MKKMSSFLHFLYWVCMSLVLGCGVVHSNVIYDRKALIIDGQRRILFSGSIHYTRSTPEMWEDLINKAREGGIDVIQTYVFWNVHEPTPGNYNFEGRYDLVKFLKTIQKAGLFAHLRIGPYICAEWNFGGFPVWLKFVPGISFRTDNEPFKMAMQGFTEKIVNLMKSEKLYESQGGPIILSQIENEYGPQEGKMGSPGRAYATWAANMAVGLDTGVPWVMCKEDDAPDPVINTCNGFYCNNFSPNKPNKPLMWTEAWTGWFTEFGGPMYQRPVEDLAFAVASFVQKGGAFVNYYMYHGGTNFGRSAGGSYITTSYDYDAPLDEYGLIRQPKYGHLKELHKAVKQSERALTSADPTVTSLGSLQEAHVYGSESGDCAAFLANYDTENRAMVTFKSKQYNLPPWSISILPDCQTEAFNTAKVGVQTSHMEMISTNTPIQSWQTYNEDVYPAYDDFGSFSSGLMEQINITRDITDYLWYKTSVEVDVSESFLKTQELPTLVVHSMGDGLHVFVNGELIGSAFGTKTNTRFTFTKGINLHAGTNVIALLSVAIGLPNVGIHFEEWSTGVLGPVVLEGFNQGRRDLSWSNWTYQVGLRGEDMSLFAPSSDSSIDWTTVSLGVQNLPLSWYKGYFDAPEGDEPLALDMSSMGKGQIWINGQSLGRYWTINSTGNCSSSGCGYTGIYRRTDCQVGCGQATQRWYHLPRPWLKPTQNLLVINEEVGGDPTKITVSRRSLNTVCADVSEYHPNNTKWQTESYHQTGKLYRKPMAHLNCGSGKSISSIEFASFGTPVGKCGSFLRGDCHALKSNSVIEQSCIGKQRCSVAISNMKFGDDPCPNVLKRLSVEARCGPSSP